MRLAARAIVGINAAAIAVTTGAGTDATVDVRMNGSSWINLDNPGDDRERGRTDVYVKSLPDVGPVTTFDIAFNNKGDSSYWYLGGEVVVRGPHGVTIHPFHNWLTRVYTQAHPLRLPAA